ncbi:MAG: hypothetical protein ABSB35_37595 [Bryobacteraceae bacterium]|jgi:hypothetical protein
MTGLTRRLQRLEATTARLVSPEHQPGFEEFKKTVDDYVGSLLEYLGESPEGAPIWCRSDRTLIPAISRAYGVYVRALRHYRRHAPVLSGIDAPVQFPWGDSASVKGAR